MKLSYKAIIAATFALIASANISAADNTPAEEGEKMTFLLTGASFAIPENGWFEIGCADMGVEAINKSVSGEAIYHTARRMNAGTFYTTEELDRTDLFVIGHVHNQNVANEQWLKESWEDYTDIATTTDYAKAYDYVIKRYIADCRALKDNPDSKYYGTEEGKPVRILFCTHWHDSRTNYNPAIRKLSEKWGFPLVKFDENIGFSRLDEGDAQPSLAFAHDTETINGVKYGWHPLRGSNSYIQRRMAQIFVEEAAAYMGLDIPFDYTLHPCSPLVVKGETARMLMTFTGGHYPFAIATDARSTEAAIKECPYFMEQDNVEADAVFAVAGVSDANGTVAASGLTDQTIHLADKVINCSYDSFVHQAEQSKGHADAQTLDLKNGDGWSRRIYITFPLDEVPEKVERIGIRLYFESIVLGTLSGEKRELNGIETLELEGNTSSYTANLTWDLHHNHQFDPVATTLLTRDMLGSYIGWDVTKFVKEKLAEGAQRVTFRVTTPYEWRSLSRFTSSESTTNPGKGPQMLIALPRPISSLEMNAVDTTTAISLRGTLLDNPAMEQVEVFNICGTSVLASSEGEIDLSPLAAGYYIAVSPCGALKFAVR